MKNIKVVIGANFGDEGKGKVTDSFCREFPKESKILNVRYNGGSQAGHTVVTWDGRRHIFHNFGAGSFNGNVYTFLSNYFFLDVLGYLREKEELEKLNIKPKVYISEDLSIILPYDIFVNQMVELSRDKDRHGSCGNGIWECLQRNKVMKLTPHTFIELSEEELKEKILELRDTYYKERLKGYSIEVSDEYKDIWYSENLVENYIKDTKYLLSSVKGIVSDKEILNQFDNIVFEGAQGLLLDWGNREYMPYLTASYTGLKYVEELLKLIDGGYNQEICYVTRTYFTRHGVGTFVTETSKENLRYEVNDTTNVYNEWQQDFRWGYFDLDLFVKTVNKDLEYLNGKDYKLSIAVTHCDETNGKLVLENEDVGPEILSKYIPYNYLMCVYSEENYDNDEVLKCNY